MIEKLPVAILAAGRTTPDLQRAGGVTAKALIRIGGRPIIDRMLEAVGASQTLGQVKVVCAPDSPLREHVPDLAVPASGPGFLDSMIAGLEALGRPGQLVYMTGDLPLVTAEALDHFAREALQSGASIVYSVVRREHFQRELPGDRRTFIRLRDGAVTGGNVVLASREFVEIQGPRIKQAFAARKNPIRLCAMLGWGFVSGLLLGRLSTAEVLARAQELLGITAAVVRSPYPCIGFDIDEPRNITSAERWLATRGGKRPKAKAPGSDSLGGGWGG